MSAVAALNLGVVVLQDWLWGVVGALALAVLGWWAWGQTAPNKIIDVSPPTALRLDGVPALSKDVVVGLRRYHTEAVRLYGWRSNGNGLVVSKLVEGHSELFSLAAPHAEPEQFTSFATTVSSVSVNPHPAINDVVYLKDNGGDEQFQIFLMDGETGEHKAVSGDYGQFGGVRWSNAGDRFVYYSNRRNGRDWDLFVSNRENPQSSEPVIQGGGVWVPLDWGPIDRLMLLYNLANPQNPYYTHDFRSGLTFPLFPEVNFQDFGPAKFARNGRGVFLIGNMQGDFRELFYMDWSAGTISSLTKDIPWDVQQVAVSPQGNRAVFVANEAGVSVLYELNTRTHVFAAIEGAPTGQIWQMSFSPNGQQLALGFTSANTPSSLVSFDFSSRGWTTWVDGSSDRSHALQPKSFQYNTFDEENDSPRTIPAFLYRPHGEGPFPVLVYLHGGPTAQFVPTYSELFQFLVNDLGVAVVAPNVRGSSGYGWRYTLLDNFQRRSNVFKDINHLLDWIDGQPQLDGGRVAVMGESYGGFLAMGALAFYGDRLMAGASLAGMSNLRTFLNTRRGLNQTVLVQEFGNPLDSRNRAFFDSLSPLHNVDKINKPLFIAQGLNDARVPVSESEQMVNALRAQGNEVWYVLAENEGHGFRQPENQQFLDHALALFFKTFLVVAN